MTHLRKVLQTSKKKGVTTRVALAEKPDSNRNVVKILVLLEFFANPKGLSKSTELGRPVHKFSKQWHRNNNNRCFRRRFKPFKAPTNTRAAVGKWRNIRERVLDVLEREGQCNQWRTESTNSSSWGTGAIVGGGRWVWSSVDRNQWGRFQKTLWFITQKQQTYGDGVENPRDSNWLQL